METLTRNEIVKELINLKKQTAVLKNLVILSFKDAEGDYKKSFVKRVLKKSKINPEFKFTNKKEFLKQIS